MSDFKDKLRKLLKHSSNENLIACTSSRQQYSSFVTNLFPYQTINLMREKRNVNGELMASLNTKVLSAKKKAPYQPSRIFSIDQFQKENNHEKLSYLFRSCTTKDIHNTIQQPIIISQIQLNEHENSIRNQLKMKKKINLIYKILQETDNSHNYANSPNQRLNSEKTKAFLSLSPNKRSIQKKITFSDTRNNIQSIHNSKREKSNNKLYFKHKKRLLSANTLKQHGVDDYRNQFTKSNKHYL